MPVPRVGRRSGLPRTIRLRVLGIVRFGFGIIGAAGTDRFMGAVRIIGVDGNIGIVGFFGIRILGVGTIRVARFRVMIRVGIVEVGVGIFRIPGLRVGIFGFMVRGFGISGVRVRTLGVGVRVGIRIGNIGDGSYPSISGSCLGLGTILDHVTRATTV